MGDASYNNATLPSSSSTTPTPSHGSGARPKFMIPLSTAPPPIPPQQQSLSTTPVRRPTGKGGSNTLSALGAAGRDDSLSSGWDDGESEADGSSSHDYKAWEAKFRCMNFKTTKKPSQGMAAIDSSAPETTSSDNSPTIVRRAIPGPNSGNNANNSLHSTNQTAVSSLASSNVNAMPSSSGVPSTPPVGGGIAPWNAHLLKSSHGGPGSDSGSSGNSSDCLGGSSSSSEETSAAGIHVGKSSSKAPISCASNAGAGRMSAGMGDYDIETPVSLSLSSRMPAIVASSVSDPISRSSTPGNVINGSIAVAAAAANASATALAGQVVKPRFPNSKKKASWLIIKI